MVVIKLLLLLALLLLGASFAIINNAPVVVDLYFFRPELPLSMLLLLVFGAGMVLGGLAGMVYFVRVKKENADLRRKSRLVNKEIAAQRAMSVRGH